jgi:hypothetical protein
MTESDYQRSSYEDLADAATSASMILQRVGGEGGVVGQIAEGQWAEQLSAEAATGIASLLRAMTEHVRYARAAAGALAEDSAITHGPPPPVVQMLDRSLPLNRKERFYTGTVLPMLVASDGFMHLHRFLALCGLPALDAGEGSLEGDQRFEFFTEYSFVESVFTDTDKARFVERPIDNDTPDLVVVGDDWLLAVEAKMFHNPSITSLNEQLRRQRVIVDYVARVLGIGSEQVAHIFLLPEGLLAEGLDAPVVTWEQVLKAYEVVGPRYWMNILRAALDRYEELVSRGPAFGENRDSTLTGIEIQEQFKAGTLGYHYMGRFRGLHGPDLADDMSSGSWRTRRYEVRVNPIASRNWFPVSAFIDKISAAG